jgi:hypothetical protein
MERVKLPGNRELIPPTISNKDFVEEMNYHSREAGHTTRYGECPDRSKIMENGFGESKLNIWPRDENGNLQGD